MALIAVGLSHRCPMELSNENREGQRRMSYRKRWEGGKEREIWGERRNRYM